jgi:hypothetical protein
MPAKLLQEPTWSRICRERSARQGPELRAFRTVDQRQASNQWRESRLAWRARHGSPYCAGGASKHGCWQKDLIARVWPKRGTEQVGPRVQISPLLRALDRSDPGRRWALRGLWHMPDRIIGRERFDVVCGHCRLVCAVLRSWLQVLAFSFKPKAASCRML